MTKWIERIRSHPIHATIVEYADAVNAAASREGVDAETLGAIERLRTVGAFAAQRTGSLDPSLAHPQQLDLANAGLRGSAKELRAFVTNGNPGHVENANSHADNALSSIAALAVMYGRSDLTAVGRAATSYRTSMEAALQRTNARAAAVEKEFTTLSAKLGELSNEVAAAKQRSEVFTSEVQSQFSRAQEVRSAEHAEAQKTRQDKFSTTMTEQSEKMTQQLAEWASVRTKAQAETEAALLAIREDFEDDAAKVLAQIEEHKQSAENLLAVIGGVGMTAGYQKAAVAAKRAKWLWQTVTLASFGLLIGFAWYAFIPIVGADFSWPLFAGRALLTVAVGVMAAYSARQGDGAAQLERHNHSMALELEALGPFLAPLPADKQETFRLEVGQRSFVGQRPHASVGKSPATVADVAVDKEIRSFILDFAKSLK